jgi:4-amino-4-deoxy-L-arabinose transferase-like glycosyltransferase
VFSTEHGLCQPAIQGGSAGASPSLSQHSREADLWLILWAAVPFVFFSASGSKLITYILPSIPALALLVAAWWPGSQARQDSVGPSAKLTVEPDDRVLGARCSVLGSGTDPTCPVPSEPSTEHRAPSTLSSEHPVLGGASLWRGTFGAAGVAALLAVLFPLLPRLVRKDAAPGVEPWLALAAAGLAVGAVLAPLFARRREPARVVVTLMGMAAVLLLALDRVEFTLDAVRGMRDLAGPVRARPEARLVMVNTYDQAFNFYSRHRAVIAGGVGELAFGRDHAPDAADYFRQEDALPTLLAERTPTFYLIHRKDRDRLQPLFEGRAHLVNEGRKHLLLLAPGDENVAR